MTTALQTQTATWRIDAAHTLVQFEVKHLMITKVRGRFRDVAGEVEINEADVTKSRVNIEIQTGSLDTGVPDRDAHLRSADFFEVERFPMLTFRSRSVTQAEDGLRVTGDLTIRDVTRTVELSVEESGHARDPWGGERLAYTASTKVDRRDFGLTWNKALETGGVMVGTDVAITLEVQVVREASS